MAESPLTGQSSGSLGAAGPLVGRAADLAEFSADGFGRRMLFGNERFRVILAAFEPGQQIPLHAPEVDLALAVLEGTGELMAGEEAHAIKAGDIAVIPAGTTRGVRAVGGRLIVLHVVSPPPTDADHARVAAGSAWPVTEPGPNAAELIDAEHRELRPHLAHLRQLATQIDDLDDSAARASLAEVVTFLQDDILPHARVEEEVLYPVVDGLLTAVGGATTTMAIDHREIGNMIEALASAQNSPTLHRGEIRRLLDSLQGLLEVHFTKETEVYLPLLSRLTAAQSTELVRSLESHSGGGHSHRHAQ